VSSAPTQELVESTRDASALAALAAAAERLAADPLAEDAPAALADAAARAVGADIAVVRVRRGDRLVAHALVGPPELAAEIEGSAIAAAEAEAAAGVETADLPPGIAALARRVGAGSVVVAPASTRGMVVGAVELYRVGDDDFGPAAASAARLAAAHLALAAAGDGAGAGPLPATVELVAEAVAAPSDDARAAVRLARVAADATGASTATVWGDVDGEPALLGLVGELPPGAAELAAQAFESRLPLSIEPLDRRGAVVTIRLGSRPTGALQLAFADGEPDPALQAALRALAAATAQTLRSVDRARELRLELDRTRALLAVVAQAISQLSLAHTLETAVEQVAVLLGIDAVAVYLRAGAGLAAASGRRVGGPHVAVAERLLELALGPFRARGMVSVTHAADDRRLAGVRRELAAGGIEAAHAVPLLAHDEVIGLLAVYSAAGRGLDEAESTLLAALASQLAVAVQNAQLHEQTKELGADRERALEAERTAARRLAALYGISDSFAQSLSLETTLEAVVRNVVDLVDADAAVLRMPDERGEALVPERIHVRSEQLEPALRTALAGPQRPSSRLMRRLKEGAPLELDASTARAIGGPDELLVPFLEQGSTAAILPIATSKELLATLTVLSFDRERPLTKEQLETARTVAGQAALALDNARLYQHEKRFTDSMQRSLLPRARPDVRGLELGEEYLSSARLDVGGDVYDYLELGEHALAVVVGDVTGHGVDAAADMAMAKFVFRSLAREHPEPAAFLAHANDVVCGEIAAGKFITMLFLVADAKRGEVAVASAGHPPPRLLGPDGRVEELTVRGLVLGIERGQEYDELRRPFPIGAALVLYTDGVVEARRGDELYGQERLDRLIAERAGLSARELARAVLDDCRSFGGGELRDDCAVVVLRHVG
jgi:serine phosphatase RsbU (regulator of sigma subunit)